MENLVIKKKNGPPFKKVCDKFEKHSRGKVSKNPGMNAFQPFFQLTRLSTKNETLI